MTRHTATLTWAIPVEVEALGAHIEAYINTFPIVNALRLRNSDGSDSKGAVNKLPTELVEFIADVVVQDERDRLRKLWARDYRYYQQLCQPEDHVSEKQIQYLRHAIKARIDNSAEWAEDWLGKESEMQEYVRLHLHKYVRDHLEKHEPEWISDHNALYKAWDARVENSRSTEPNFFQSKNGLTLEHFGLVTHVFSSSVRSIPKDAYWVNHAGEYSCRVTVAWLKLPDESHFKYERKAMDDEGAFSFSPPHLSSSMKKRFDDALETLGLKPYASPHHRSVLPVENGDVATQEPSEWPKMTVFMKKTNYS